MAGDKWGGKGRFDLPFEPVGKQPIAYAPPGGKFNVAGAVVVLSMKVRHPETNEYLPALAFRFSRPDGTFMDDIILVLEPEDFPKLVEIVAGAVKGATT